MHRRQIEDAIRRVGKRYPEYIYELSHIRIYKEVPGLVQQAGGPIGVDQWWRLYWDPDVEVKDDKRMDTFILHELGHLNGNDAERAQELSAGRSIVVRMIGMDPVKEAGPINQFAWNLSCDARINAELRKLDWTKTKGLVFPESLKPEWHDQSIGVKPPEWYYTQIREEAGKNPQPGEGGIPMPMSDGQKEGGQQGQPGQGGGGQGDQEGEGGGDQEGDGEGDGHGHPKGQTCGSVATGQPQGWEDAEDADCLSEDERKGIVNETERRIAQKMVEGDKRGTGIGNEAAFPMLCDPERIQAEYNRQLWIDTIQSLLYKHLQAAKRTYLQPHRRIEGLPGKRRHPKQAVIVCDISGSINELSVVRTFDVIDRLYGRGFDIRIVACDTEGHVVTDRKARYSGGGTDMAEGVRFAHAHFPHASCIIVITDGGTGWQEENPTGKPVYVMSWHTIGPEWAMNIPMPGLTDDYPVKPDWSNARARRRYA